MARSKRVQETTISTFDTLNVRADDLRPGDVIMEGGKDRERITSLERPMCGVHVNGRLCFNDREVRVTVRREAIST